MALKSISIHKFISWRQCNILSVAGKIIVVILGTPAAFFTKKLNMIDYVVCGARCVFAQI